MLTCNVDFSFIIFRFLFFITDVSLIPRMFQLPKCRLMAWCLPPDMKSTSLLTLVLVMQLVLLPLWHIHVR